VVPVGVGGAFDALPLVLHTVLLSLLELLLVVLDQLPAFVLPLKLLQTLALEFGLPLQLLLLPPLPLVGGEVFLELFEGWVGD